MSVYIVRDLDWVNRNIDHANRILNEVIKPGRFCRLYDGTLIKGYHGQVSKNPFFTVTIEHEDTQGRTHRVTNHYGVTRTRQILRERLDHGTSWYCCFYAGYEDTGKVYVHAMPREGEQRHD